MSFHGRVNSTRIKRALCVQAALEWAFRIEQAQLELPRPADITEEGFGFGLEYVLLSPPYLVFTREPDGWRQVGQLQFQGIPASPSEVEKSLFHHDYAVEPRRFNDLKLGGRIGGLMVRPEEAKH